VFLIEAKDKFQQKCYLLMYEKQIKENKLSAYC